MKNKFRGLASNGRWVYGTPVYYQSGEVAIFNDSCPTYGYEATRIAEMRELVNPNTVGQFTRITDKNNVELFEGDIYTHKNKKWLIKYSENQMVLLAKQIGSGTNWQSLEDVKRFSKYIQIIGSIHTPQN